MTDMNVNEFAALVLAQTQERLRTDYPASPQWEWERVAVKPGPVYTKVDIGPEGNMSGKYMIENSTGIIFGIKGYGKVHKGHRYGTLDTVDSWYWGGYTGTKIEPAKFVADPASPTDAELTAAIERGLADGSLIDAGQWMAQNRDSAPAAETEILRKDVPYGADPAWLVRRNGQLFVISTGVKIGDSEPETQAFRVSEPSMKITDWDDVAGGRGVTKEQVLAELTQRPVDEHGYVLSRRDVMEQAEAEAELAAGTVQVKRDGIVQATFAGPDPVQNSNDAFAWLLRHQGMSTDWAIKHEGWEITDPAPHAGPCDNCGCQS